MSPEQARGDTDIDARADIYSLGATLFYMLAGDVPYKDPVPAVVMAKHITAEVPWARDVNPKVSDAASRVVARMMAKDRAHRYQNCDQLILDLKAVLSGGLIAAPTRERMPGVKPPAVKEAPAPPPKKEPPPKAKPASHTALLTVGLVASLGLAAYLWYCSMQTNSSLDRLIEISYRQAMQAAKENPHDRKENYRRFQQLKEAARGTRFEPLIDEEIKKLLPRPRSIESRE
jgi:hypothetical protein